MDSGGHQPPRETCLGKPAVLVIEMPTLAAP
jgi:hypothetical protein